MPIRSRDYLASLPLRIAFDDAFRIRSIGWIACGRIATGTLRTGMKVRAEGNPELAVEKLVGSITGPAFSMQTQTNEWVNVNPVQSHIIEEAKPGMIVGFNVKCVSGRSFHQQKKHLLISDGA